MFLDVHETVAGVIAGKGGKRKRKQQGEAREDEKKLSCSQALAHVDGPSRVFITRYQKLQPFATGQQGLFKVQVFKSSK